MRRGRLIFKEVSEFNHFDGFIHEHAIYTARGIMGVMPVMAVTNNQVRLHCSCWPVFTTGRKWALEAKSGIETSRAPKDRKRREKFLANQ
jgi:hypothetical protein